MSDDSVILDSDLIGHPVTEHQRSSRKGESGPTTFPFGVLVGILPFAASQGRIFGDAPSLSIDLSSPSHGKNASHETESEE
jgi:hypothetical protein